MTQKNPDLKRFPNATRFFTYGVMTMAVIALSALVILLSLGYRFDRNLSIVREGLVQLGNRPVEAHYSIDGKLYDETTPAKVTLPAGNYLFGISQDGYRSWQKQVSVIAGKVHWMNYARLIPNSLSPQTIKPYGKATFAQASPDKRWILADVGAEKRNQLELIDLKDPAKPAFSSLIIPEEVLTKKDGALGTLSFVEWSLDSKHVLLRHTNGDVTEFLRLDRTKPSETININMRFQLAFDDPHLSGGDANIVFARTKDALRRFDIAANTVSGVLLSGVKSYEVYGDSTIVYARIATEAGEAPVLQVGLMVKDKNNILNELPADNEVLVGYKDFDHHTYFALANQTTKQVKIFQDPLQDAPAAGPNTGRQVFTQFEDIKPVHMQFSPSGRFLMVRDGSQLGVYDFYEQQKFEYTAPEKIDNSIPVKWLDEFRVTAVKDGVLQMWEFDGTNKQTLVGHTTNPAVSPLLDEDDDMLYTFNQPDAKSPAIQFNATSLKIR